MVKIIIMLILSIILNVLSLLGQHLENNEINLYQLIGLIFQIICVILLF